MKVPPAPKNAKFSSYIGMLIIGLVLTSVILYYYLSHSTSINKQLFYLLLVLFGVGVSLLLFSTMKSIAKLTGQVTLGKYSFSGPVVGVIAIVVGYFYFNPQASLISVKVRVFDEKSKSPVGSGEVKLYFREIKSHPLNSEGQAEFDEIQSGYIGRSIRYDILPTGLYMFSTDTIIIPEDGLINLYIKKQFSISIAGKVETAGNIPIVDAEVAIRGTNHMTRTRTDGTFDLGVSHFAEAKMELIVSANNYQDKPVPITLTGVQTNVGSIILASNRNPDGR